jgi:hypothetical protein
MARRLGLCTIPFAGLALLAAPRAHAQDADDRERYTLRAELGSEYDSNAHRTETVAGVTNAPVVASPLARAVVSGTFYDVIAPGHEIALSASAAGKLFAAADARGEDVGIAESGLLWRAALGQRTTFALSGAYYEAFQRAAAAPDAGASATQDSAHHDFRSLTPSARLGLRVAPGLDLGAGGGYRLFVFKPARDFDFHAPMASVDARWARESSDGGADWEATLRGAFERRTFAGSPLVGASSACPVGPCPPSFGAGTRVDTFVTGGFDLARTGAVLLGGGYAVHVNSSNSFGSTATRHFASARFAAALPLELYLAARSELLLAARYADPAAGRAFLSIEDENRSHVRAELSRNLTPELQLIARYTFYFNPLGGSLAAYTRHTALLSLAFALEK